MLSIVFAGAVVFLTLFIGASLSAVLLLARSVLARNERGGPSGESTPPPKSQRGPPRGAADVARGGPVA